MEKPFNFSGKKKHKKQSSILANSLTSVLIGLEKYEAKYLFSKVCEWDENFWNKWKEGSGESSLQKCMFAILRIIRACG